ncbi:Protein of unknown function [Gryllus bimaculatus]|nr:Protein of unknown function [Gryllus bimaculatus]
MIISIKYLLSQPEDAVQASSILWSALPAAGVLAGRRSPSCSCRLARCRRCRRPRRSANWASPRCTSPP